MKARGSASGGMGGSRGGWDGGMGVGWDGGMTRRGPYNKNMAPRKCNTQIIYL